MDVDDINDEQFSEDEAVEDKWIGDDEEVKGNDSEEQGEDLMENMEKDYKAVDELDRYEEQGIDDEDQEELETR